MSFFSKLSPFFAAALIMFTFGVAAWFLWAGLEGQLSPHQAIKIKSHEEMRSRPYLQKTNAACEKTPCLVVKHKPDVMIVTLYERASSPEYWQERLKTTIQVYRGQDGRPSRVSTRHKPTNDFEDELEKEGIFMPVFREHRVLFEITGRSLWRDAKIELPVGSLSQYFMDAYRSIDAAMDNGTDANELQRLANVAAAQANARFGLQDLAENLRVSQIVFGPIQTGTYAMALLAMCLAVLSLFNERISGPMTSVTDLIPFTGFFGTLLGVLLAVAGLSINDITDDVRKAMTLGLIGNALSLAINTTICAIAVFGAVILAQTGLDLTFAKGTTPQTSPDAKGSSFSIRAALKAMLSSLQSKIKEKRSGTQ